MENGKYKYEIHCHTKETSNCGKTGAAQLVRLYKSMGYDGVVITDHYSRMTFKEWNAFTVKKHIEKFFKGYYAAKEAAGEDFTVLLGMELRGWCSPIDYLVYGVTEDFIRNSPNLLFKYAKRFYKMAQKNHFLVIAPHPYRMSPFLPCKKAIDGVQIVNGKAPDEKNEKGALWAKKNGFKILTYGSDFHRPTHKKFCAILTNEPIKSNDDLIRILKSGEYETARRIKEQI